MPVHLSARRPNRGVFPRVWEQNYSLTASVRIRQPEHLKTSPTQPGFRYVKSWRARLGNGARYWRSVDYLRLRRDVSR